MPARVGPDNHIEVCKIKQGGSRVIIGWHVRNVFAPFLILMSKCLYLIIHIK